MACLGFWRNTLSSHCGVTSQIYQLEWRGLTDGYENLNWVDRECSGFILMFLNCGYLRLKKKRCGELCQPLCFFRKTGKGRCVHLGMIDIKNHPALFFGSHLMLVRRVVVVECSPDQIGEDCPYDYSISLKWVVSQPTHGGCGWFIGYPP